MGLPSGKFSNPADVFMKALALNYPKQLEDEERINVLVNHYQKQQAQSVLNEMNSCKVPPLDFGLIKSQIAPFSIQYAQLWYRTVRFVQRCPNAAFARLSTGVFNGLLTLAIWWQVNGNTRVDIANMTGSLFIILTNTFMGTFFSTISVFQIERPVFLREQAN